MFMDFFALVIVKTSKNETSIQIRLLLTLLKVCLFVNYEAMPMFCTSLLQ
jgi:hypothetical protein